MRFVLDHDVPRACLEVLTTRSHEAWTVGDAGRATASDDDQTAYAMEKGAVVLTLDREFTLRRRRNTIGRHVRIACPEPDAARVLATYHDDVLPLLEHHVDITIEVRPSGIRTFHNWE